MKGNRGRRLLMGLAAASLLVGCASTPATPSSRGSAPSIAPRASATELSASPFATPTAALSSTDSAAVAEATRIIEALGGQVSPADEPDISRADPTSGGPGTEVDLGDWQVGWNSEGALTWVYDAAALASPAPAKLTDADARVRVGQVLAALGVSLGAADSFTYEETVPDWRAQWNRTLDGVQVPGDGSWVVLGPDGAFNAYGYQNSPTAPEPAKLLTKAQVLAANPYCRNTTHGPNGKTESCTIGLVWYQSPTATPEKPLQLCWEIKYSWSDANQNNGGSILWIDAGTGEQVDAASTM